MTKDELDFRNHLVKKNIYENNFECLFVTSFVIWFCKLTVGKGQTFRLIAISWKIEHQIDQKIPLHRVSIPINLSFEAHFDPNLTRYTIQTSFVQNRPAKSNIFFPLCANLISGIIWSRKASRRMLIKQAFEAFCIFSLSKI